MLSRAESSRRAGDQQVRAEFVQRLHCISCRSSNLRVLSSRRYHDNPLRDILANDPWGEDPLPYLEGKRWTFVECNDCTQKFHRDILSPEWNEIRLSRWMTHEAIQTCLEREMTPARLFDRAVEHTEHVLRLELLTRKLRAGKALRVLDYGSGYGEFLCICKQFGYEAIGVDRSDAKRSNSRHDLVFAGIDELLRDRGTEEFHAITLFETLEHLDDPRSTLDELTNLLVPEGILVLETPDCTGVTDITCFDESWRIQPLDHINAFTPASLCKLAERCGYVPIRTPTAWVTARLYRAAKVEAKALICTVGWSRATTRQYFRKQPARRF